jgi:hypothetical protein
VNTNEVLRVVSEIVANDDECLRAERGLQYSNKTAEKMIRKAEDAITLRNEGFHVVVGNYRKSTSKGTVNVRMSARVKLCHTTGYCI